MNRYIAEFVGTLILVFCGTGAIIVNDLSGGIITHVGIAIVFGLVVAGQNVVNALAGLPVIDARCNQSLRDDPDDDEAIRSELSQLPLVDFDVEPLPELVTFCMLGDNEVDACLQPLCNEPSADGLTCDDPLCYSLIPLSDAEQELIDQGGEVDRFCDAMEQAIRHGVS